ncbi:MAG: response regulator [Planctomycetes bacterium]|nr:response regulator [Planctomycetota bacterium]
MSEKILYVDDDPNILAAQRRMHGGRFALETADSGQAGCELVASKGPYAVVISDMRMPGMDGVQFLARVKVASPDTVRIMLTGSPGLDTAIQAVNKGQIFRFLTKPCPPEIFAGAIEAGLRQYALITAERELLEKTLNGSIKVLMEVLSLVNPLAFGRACRLRRYAQHIIRQLGLSDGWRYEIAATLSQIGCVVLSSDILRKVYTGQELDDKELQAYASHPKIAGQLLSKIPRMEDVAGIIAAQPVQGHQEQADLETKASASDAVAFGSELVWLVTELDRLVSGGMQVRQAVSYMLERPAVYWSKLVAALQNIDTHKSMASTLVKVSGLREAMILDQDVYAKNGNLIVTRGHEVTYAVMEHLMQWSSGVGIKEPIQVLMPGNDNPLM